MLKWAERPGGSTPASPPATSTPRGGRRGCCWSCSRSCGSGPAATDSTMRAAPACAATWRALHGRAVPLARGIPRHAALGVQGGLLPRERRARSCWGWRRSSAATPAGDARMNVGFARVAAAGAGDRVVVPLPGVAGGLPAVGRARHAHARAARGGGAYLAYVYAYLLRQAALVRRRRLRRGCVARVRPAAVVQIVAWLDAAWTWAARRRPPRRAQDRGPVGRDGRLPLLRLPRPRRAAASLRKGQEGGGGVVGWWGGGVGSNRYGSTTPPPDHTTTLQLPHPSPAAGFRRS